MRRRHALREALGSTLAIGVVAGLAWLAVRDRSRDAKAQASRGARHADALPDVPDEDLAARVRARVAIPREVEVAAQDGAIVLFGRVPRWMVAELLERVANVEGVTDVEDRLTPVDHIASDRP